MERYEIIGTSALKSAPAMGLQAIPESMETLYTRFINYTDVKDTTLRNYMAYIRRFLVMVLPIFLGKAINSINILIDKSIASLLTEGVVSVMNYGNRITGFVTSVFVVSITTALFPQLSRLSFRNLLDFGIPLFLANHSPV